MGCLLQKLLLLIPCLCNDGWTVWVLLVFCHFGLAVPGLVSLDTETLHASLYALYVADALARSTTEYDINVSTASD